MEQFTEKPAAPALSPMTVLQYVIGGKWKLLILWYLAYHRIQRFGELKKRLTGITQSTLTKQLRELERDQFIKREVYKEIPPRVEYSLTEFGETFIPVLRAMMNWSRQYLTPDKYPKELVEKYGK